MNARAIGCAALGIVLFVAVGVAGLMLAMPGSGCPPRLQWADLGYLPVGSPAPSPSLDGQELVVIGSTFVGLTTLEVYAPPDAQAAASAGVRPEQVVVSCGDGTFLAYRAAR